MKHYLAKRLHHFHRCEEGSTSIFVGLSLIVLITAIGVAVDMARAQTLQTRLSAALDIAGLAVGAHFDNPDHQGVANKYFFANYPQNYLSSQSITQPVLTISADQLTITLNAGTSQATAFMPIVGINNVNVAASTEVKRALSSVELVMVFDNTGTMGDTVPGDTEPKITAEKEVATTLVNQLFGDNATAGQGLFVGMVPFAATVNLGMTSTDINAATPKVLYPNWLDATYDSSLTWPGTAVSPTTNWGGCVMTRSSQDTDPANGLTYDISDAPPSQTNPLTLFGQYQAPPVAISINDNTWATGSGSTLVYSSQPFTNTYGPNQRCPAPIIPMTQTKQTILDGINLLQPNGSTELTAGLEWGWRMISPRWQGLWGGEMDANNLPQPYSTPYISKQIIFVTDGINQSDSRYYSSYGFTSPNTSASDPTNPDPYNVNLPAGVLTNLATQDIFDNGPAPIPSQDTKFMQLCNAIKNAYPQNPVIIWTIGYGLPGDVNQTQLKNCATDPSHYFLVPTKAELDSVFQQIINSLQNLRISK